MKPTIRSLICVATVLFTFCVHIPAVRADDAADYVDQIYRDQQVTDDYLEKVQETERYVDQIYQDQRERDDYLNNIGQNAQPEAPEAGPVAVPQAIPFVFPAQAAPQWFPMPLDPRQVFAFQQMQLLQIMQMQQLQRMRFQR